MSQMTIRRARYTRYKRVGAAPHITAPPVQQCLRGDYVQQSFGVSCRVREQHIMTAVSSDDSIVTEPCGHAKIIRLVVTQANKTALRTSTSNT